MTKTTTILAFSVVLALIIGIVSSGPMVDAVKPPPTSESCPAENVKIIATYQFAMKVQIEHASEPSTDRGLVHVVNDLDKVLTSEQISIIDRLNELGYFVTDGSPRDLILDDLSGFAHSDNKAICMTS